MNQNKKYKINVNLMYGYNITFFTTFIYPIITLFYLSKNLTFTNIATIAAITAAATIILEVPSGIMADRWGRKKTLILSQAFTIITMIIMMFGKTLLDFGIAGFFYGSSMAFYSGSSTSMLYDSLKKLKREKSFQKTIGYIFLFASISGFFSALIGGYLFEINPTTPFVLTLLTGVLGLGFAIAMTEIKTKKKEKIAKHFIGSIKEITSKKQLKFIALYTLILMFAFRYIFTYGQVQLQDMNITITTIGLIYAIRLLIEGIPGALNEKLKKYFGEQKLFLMILIYSTITILLLSLNLNKTYTMIMFVLVFVATGLHRIVAQGFLHKNISSHNRATIESMIMFMIGVTTIIFEPILGFVADKFSIETSFMILSIILVGYSIYYIKSNKAKMKHTSKKQYSQKKILK